jgi:hypothetical protein
MAAVQPGALAPGPDHQQQQLYVPLRVKQEQCVLPTQCVFVSVVRLEMYMGQYSVQLQATCFHKGEFFLWFYFNSFID